MLKLASDGRHIELVSAEEILKVPLLERIIWCQNNARYTIVTKELIDWLREMIAGRTALEVAAGQGDIGFHLSIPMTDSYVQTLEYMNMAYSAVGQTSTEPPPYVERIGAVKAVLKYRPQVVIASWLTHKWQRGMTKGFVHGADEVEILRNVGTYIHIGNDAVHDEKPILRLSPSAFPRDEYRPPWLLSRAVEPEKNVIYVWRGSKRR